MKPFALAAAAIFILRRRAGGPPPPGRFRTPGYPIVPALFVAASLFTVASAVRSSPRRSAAGAALLATGIPVYYAYSRRQLRRAARITP